MPLDTLFFDQLSQLGAPTAVTPVTDATLQHVNHPLRQSLNLSAELFNEQQCVTALTTKQGILTQKSFAQKYGGHQFGQWNPELGDGRGLLLGNTYDEHNNPVDLHLKGAGRTPYSRFGDGRAVLRSTIREYLASEALHALGIPTSRALCLISSEEAVQRESIERAAMMVRTAPSHIRFGHFEYFYHSKQTQALNALFEFCFTHYFPIAKSTSNPHFHMLKEIVLSTANMIAHWQAQGFAHGVMNTDNMSIHGITFDFGPYGFLDDYEPNFIPNHSDHNGRYRFSQQPGVALWNLNALAHAFTPYLEHEQIVTALTLYENHVGQRYATLMRKKLGLSTEQDADQQLLEQFLSLLQQDKADYHASFSRLQNSLLANDESSFSNHFIYRDDACHWWRKYAMRLGDEGTNLSQTVNGMKMVNPNVVLRNYYAQLAITDAENGDYSTFKQLLNGLELPFNERESQYRFTQLPPDSGKGLEISCSS